MIFGQKVILRFNLIARKYDILAYRKITFYSYSPQI